MSNRTCSVYEEVQGRQSRNGNVIKKRRCGIDSRPDMTFWTVVEFSFYILINKSEFGRNDMQFLKTTFAEYECQIGRKIKFTMHLVSNMVYNCIDTHWTREFANKWNVFIHTLYQLDMQEWTTQEEKKNQCIRDLKYVNY